MQRSIRNDPFGNIGGLYNIMLYKNRMNQNESNLVTRSMYSDPQRMLSSSLYVTPRPKTVKPMSSDHSKITTAAKVFEESLKTRKVPMKSAPTNKSSSISARVSSASTKIPQLKEVESKPRHQSAVETILKHTQKKLLRRQSNQETSTPTSARNGTIRHISSTQNSTGRPRSPQTGRRSSRKIAGDDRSSEEERRPETSKSLMKENQAVCEKYRLLSQ